MRKYIPFIFSKKTVELLVTTLVILVSLGNGGGVAAIDPGLGQLLQAGAPHVDPAVDCTTGAASVTNTTDGITTADFTYTDPDRANRKVGVTIWTPNDGQPHPLVMFAPGRFQDSKAKGFYDRYLRATAAAGFVVAGADFSDNTTEAAATPDAQDIKFLIGKVQADTKILPQIDDTKGVGLIGHSDGALIALIDGFSDKADNRIKAVIAADGALSQGYSFNGPAANHSALLLMHGDADTTQNISGSVGAYATINAPYKAFATFEGADHYHYITGDTDAGKAYTPAVDAVTSSYLRQTLSGDATAPPLKTVQGSFTSIFTLQETGNPAAAGNGTVSSATGTTPASCCATTTSSVSADDASLTGSDNEQKIWNYLTGKGLKPFQAAGIMGNMQAESGFNPHSQEPGTTSDAPNERGHGIVQWTPGTELLPLANNDLPTLNSLAWQLNILWNQLTVKGSKPIDHTDAGDAVKASKDIAGATEAFENLFEIHQGPAQPQRITNAQGVLAKYGSGAPSSDDPVANLSGASCASDASSGSNCNGTAGQKILCEAEKFDAYGYHLGGGHGDPAVFMQHFKGAVTGNTADQAWMGAQYGGGPPWPGIVDCSGLVLVSMWNAFGVKTGFADVAFISSSDSITGKPLFRPISLDEVQPGDVIGHPGHVAIATGTGPNTAFFNAENPDVALPNQILLDSSWKPGWTVAGRYIGPGS
jgi:hypothetical protein